MTNDASSKKYNLEERTAKFGESVITFCVKLSKNPITDPLINQLIRSSTSIGANYCEADDAESAKDFKHKIGICKKEARESKHFLRMLAIATPGNKEKLKSHWVEAKELNLIFNSIYHKLK